MVKIKKMKAHPSRLHGFRSKSKIQYIVIHYTGNVGDTAENNGKYFSRTDLAEVKDSNNPRYGVGAHFFVDKAGVIVRSIPMSRMAWAVGGRYTTSGGAGSYYSKCNNYNSVSIELCDCTLDVSWQQMMATMNLVKYIQKKCPNAKTIIRHWDVNGKNCPAPMIGTGNKRWKHLHNMLTKGYQFKAEVVDKDTYIRSSRGIKENNKLGKVKIGTTVKVVKVVDGWGRLLNKSDDGHYRWINLKKVKEV